MKKRSQHPSKATGRSTTSAGRHGTTARASAPATPTAAGPVKRPAAGKTPHGVVKKRAERAGRGEYVAKEGTVAGVREAIVADGTWIFASRRGGRKRPTNLSLSPEALERGEAFARDTRQSLSALVDAFLAALPGRQATAETHWPPAVRRLVGIGRAPEGAPPDDPQRDYNRYRDGKYGDRS